MGKNNLWSARLISGLSVVAFSQSSFAAVNYLDLSLEQLLNVKVHSASKKEEMIADSPVAVYAITGADIERSGVTTIPDALRMVPGVEVARADSNSWAISIRGFNSTLANKLLVLVDGRSIYNPVFGGVMWEANDLMVEDIDRIEVIRGPGGALWGANAVNGVINIITKHTRETQGTLVSATVGNEEKATLSVRHGGSVGAEGSYRVYAKGFRRDASVKPDVSASSGEDTYDEWDGFRTGFRLDWNDEFTLQGDAYRTDTEQLRADHSLTAPFTTVEQQNIIYEGVNLLGRWTAEQDDGALLSIQSYVDWSKRDEPFNFADERTTFDLEAQYNFVPSTRHEVIAGAGIRYLSDDKRGNANVMFDTPKDESAIYSAFVQDKITLSKDKWFLTAGTKIEHNDFSGTEVQPNIRLHREFEASLLWASISKAVRTPTPIETDITSTLATAESIRVAFVPNEEFKTEKLTAYEIGYRKQISSSVSIDVATFYNDYKQLATTTPSAPVLVINTIDPPHFLVPVQFTNDMTGHATGAELALGWTPYSQLHISATYSYLNLLLDAIDPSHEGAEHLSPMHRVGTRVFWDVSDTWSVNVTANYTDAIPALLVDDYVRLDINIGGRISETIKFNLIAQNLLESTHREFGSPNDMNAGEIERSIFGKVSWHF